MFTKRATNPIAINSLIDRVSVEGGKDADKIVAWLDNAMAFLMETAPEYQAARDKKIRDEDIKKILDHTAKGFANYNEVASNNVLAKAAMEYCQKVILERLASMESKGDRIFKYYDSHANLLKSILTSSNTPKLT